MGRPLIVTDLVYQGAGFIVTFNDNSVATGLYQFKNDNNPCLIGLSSAQESALAKYNVSLIPAISHAGGNIDIRLHHFRHGGVHYTEDDSETTNATNSYLQKLQLKVTAIDDHHATVDDLDTAHNYEIHWSAEIKKIGGSGAKVMDVRVTHDGTQVLGIIHQNKKSDWSSFAGVKHQILKSTHDFIMDFRTPDGVAHIRNARLVCRSIK